MKISRKKLKQLWTLSHGKTHWRIQGGRRWRAPPNGIQFFCFCMRFCQKAAASEVGAPNGSAPPQREILDPPLKPFE